MFTVVNPDDPTLAAGAGPTVAGGSLIDGIVRDGARRMLAAALEAEVAAYVAAHTDQLDEDGRRLVVRNGHARPRQVLTSAGAVEVAAPRLNEAHKASPREVAEQRAQEDAGLALASQETTVEVPTAGEVYRRPGAFLPLEKQYSGAAVEKTTIAQIAQSLGPVATLVSDVKLGPGRYADAVLVSRVAELPNYIVEVKRVGSSTPARTRALVREMAGWALAATAKATKDFNSYFVPLVVFVVVPGYSQLPLPGLGTAEEDEAKVRTVVVEEAKDLNNFPGVLIFFVTSADRIDLSRLFNSRTSSVRGVHVFELAA